MSSPQVNSTLSSAFQTTGGIPNSSDTVPSIALLCAYIALAPVILFRAFAPSSRTKVLIRPAVFVIGRIVTWGIRIYLAKRTTPAATKVYTIESVLISIGISFLTEPLISLLSYLVGPYASKDDVILRQGFVFLRIAVLGSVGLGVVAGQMAGKANSDLNTIKLLRTISAVITCGLVAICAFVLVKAKSIGAPNRAIITLIPAIAAVAAGAIFKLIQSLDHDASSFINKKATFYILLSVPEWIATAIFSIPNLVTLFEISPGGGFAPGENSGGRRRGGLLGNLMGSSGQDQVEHAESDEAQAMPPPGRGSAGRRGGLIGSIAQTSAPAGQGPPQYGGYDQAPYAPPARGYGRRRGGLISGMVREMAAPNQGRY